jgi:CheY-like chemotaxis protein
VLGRKLAGDLQEFRLDTKTHMKRVQITREPMPYGSVLVVDDVETNIYVTRGLLAPYALSVDTAENGPEAIEKIKNGSVYDIIFMDHMMPGMSGIEAVKIIREMGYPNPIVALTADALAGQADVFLKNGFDDFISKPIDIRQLNTVLNKLVRDKHPPEVVLAARSKTGDVKGEPSGQAAAQTSINPQLAKIFLLDASKAIKTLEGIQEKNDAYGEDDIQMYTITVHAMKSALANIGEKELSAVALKLENAGRNRDTALMSAETLEFLEDLRAIKEKLEPPKEKDESGDLTEQDLVYLREKLRVVQEACSAYDKKTAKDALAELKEKPWPENTKEVLDRISEYLLYSDFEEAVEIAGKLI